MKRICYTFVLLVLLLPLNTYADSIETTNILLLGTDNFGYGQGTEIEEMSRADAIYVMSLNPDAGSIKLLSIERDYLVTLPGDLGENKLGTATFFGGPKMCLDAVNQLFNLDIPLYAHIDITNLIKAIDLFGGIDIEILSNEVESVNLFIAGSPPFTLPGVQSGLNHLDGFRTWAFLAVRDMDGDAIKSNKARNDRQERVFAACLEKAVRMDVSGAMNLAFEILPLIKTNLSVSDLLRVIQIVLDANLENLEYSRTPFGSYQIKHINMHRALVADDMPAEIKIVHDFLSK